MDTVSLRILPYVILMPTNVRDLNYQSSTHSIQNMSTILTFFLAMVLHPDIQAKARAEIDSVVDQDRLPTIADKQDLPYVRSVIAEVFRWQPAGPLGLHYHLFTRFYAWTE